MSATQNGHRLDVGDAEKSFAAFVGLVSAFARKRAE